MDTWQGDTWQGDTWNSSLAGRALKGSAGRAGGASDVPLEWRNPMFGSFDDFGQAMLLLFVMSTGDNWGSVMYWAMDTQGEDEPRARDDSSAVPPTTPRTQRPRPSRCPWIPRYGGVTWRRGMIRWHADVAC